MIYDYDNENILLDNNEDFDEHSYRCEIYDYGHKLDYDKIYGTSEYYKLIYRVFILSYIELLKDCNVHRFEYSLEEICIELPSSKAFTDKFLCELKYDEIIFNYYVTEYSECKIKHHIIIDMDNLDEMYAFYY